MAAITNDWLEPLSAEFRKPYYAELYKKIKAEYAMFQVYPPAGDILNAGHPDPAVPGQHLSGTA